VSEPPGAETPLLVACLCAAWCRTCGDYHDTFDALAREFAAQARFVWVDIEDDEAVLGTVDVVDFPTLLVARGDEIRFFGPVTPHAQTARQLVQRALLGQLGAVADAALAGLPARLRALK
jgi:thioredoxin 1